MGNSIVNTAARQNERLISEEIATAVQIMNKCFLGLLITTVGTASSISNIVVFIKLGFTETTNISLMAMSFSDLLGSLSFQWTAIGWIAPLVNLNIPWASNDVTFLTGGCLYSSFTRITSWLTAFITFERCLCVAIPLRVKQIITLNVTVFFIIAVYILMLLTGLPEYVSMYLGWKFNAKMNRTLFGIIYRENRGDYAGKSFILLSVSQISSFSTVLIFTAILVIKMRQNITWRNQATLAVSENSVNRERQHYRTVKMIIFVATMYNVCYLPSVLLTTCGIIVPELSVSGEFRNVYLVCWSTAFVMEAVNSSCSIFIYYNMSSKYRIMFKKIFAILKEVR